MTGLKEQKVFSEQRCKRTAKYERNVTKNGKKVTKKTIFEIESGKTK